MSKIKWKNLCFPNFIKCLPTVQAPTDQPSNQNPPPPPSTTTTTTCTSLLIKNFNTLYDFNLINSSSSKSLTPSFSSSSSADYVHTSSSDSDSDLSPPDFATIFASQRFFFSSPGRSNSITESPHTTTTEPNKPHHKTTLVTKGVRVLKFSSNPYLDFRRSMEEMLEANRDHYMLVGHDHHHHHHSTSDDVEYLHELLLRYLSLNPKHAHKDIISAFTDLVICLLSANSSAPASAADHSRENPQTH